MTKRPPKEPVVRVDRSPMNAQRWRLKLGCGHEKWVTRKRRPVVKTTHCLICEGEP